MTDSSHRLDCPVSNFQLGNHHGRLLKRWPSLGNRRRVDRFICRFRDGDQVLASHAIHKNESDAARDTLDASKVIDADSVWFLCIPRPSHRLKRITPSEPSAFLRPLSFSSTAAAIAFPTRPCALIFETSRCGWAGSKTANARASTTYDIRLPAAFCLNGAFARPDKRTASTGCPTTSGTSASPTLIGIFQPLQNSLPTR